MTEPAAPLDIASFLETNALARADIVLIMGTSLFSRAVRFATRSPFSHAALVFLIPDRGSGFKRTFLIEAVPKGVSIRALGDILEGHGAKGGHDALAILRLDRPWFDEDLQKRVRGRLLDYIRAGYDWSTVICWPPEQILHGHRQVLAELLATTPDEISSATTLMWKYVIKDRKVYEATNRAEAIAILTGKSPK